MNIIWYYLKQYICRLSHPSNWLWHYIVSIRHSYYHAVTDWCETYWAGVSSRELNVDAPKASLRCSDGRVWWKWPWWWWPPTSSWSIWCNPGQNHFTTISGRNKSGTCCCFLLVPGWLCCMHPEDENGYQRIVLLARPMTRTYTYPCYEHDY